jgi:hypothetical protein
MITFILGICFSLILKLIKLEGKELIYTDEAKTLVNPNLFMPPKAKMIQRRNADLRSQMSKEHITRF